MGDREDRNEQWTQFTRPRVAFDLLHRDGADLRLQPLIERRALLSKNSLAFQGTETTSFS
jgi:ATP-dependent DNA ligase